MPGIQIVQGLNHSLFLSAVCTHVGPFVFSATIGNIL